MQTSLNKAEPASGAIIQSALKSPGRTGLWRGVRPVFQQVDRVIVLREQARSHRDFQRTQNLRSARINLWERACSRWRWVRRQGC
ncbi:hypothetical protein D3C78_755480 [compost metagenome]